MAGLIAAHAFPRLEIVEASTGPQQTHNALLRFRSDIVGRLVGIDFRCVRVHKGIWYGSKFVRPSIRIANMYSLKCTEAMIGDRSVWNVETTDRWVAPEDFYDRLIDSAGRRINWGVGASFDSAGPLINTAPLPVALKATGIAFNAEEFQRAPIMVKRWRVPNADIFQTIYFPAPHHGLYRASITGDLLIAEFISSPSSNEDLWRMDLNDAFGAPLTEIAEPIDDVEQQFGKIIPLTDDVRRSYLHHLTAHHDIYSLGRFATWRNLLLDDLVHDIDVVKRLIDADSYAGKMFGAGAK